jgi:hypothetical protein
MKFVYELFGYLIGFVWLLFYPKAVLAARLLAVQSQLAMCKNRIDLKKDFKSTRTPKNTTRYINKRTICCSSECNRMFPAFTSGPTTSEPPIQVY